VDLSGCILFTDVSVLKLPQCCAELQFLGLRGCTLLSESCLATVRQHPNLWISTEHSLTSLSLE